MKITQELSLDTSRENAYKVVHAKQYDEDSRFLKVTITTRGEEIDIPSGATVVFGVKRADLESHDFAGVVNTDGTVTVPLTNWMLQVAGKCVCDVSIIKDGEKFSTLNFSVFVEYAPTNETDITEDEKYDIFVNLIERVENVVDHIDELEQSALNSEASAAASARSAEDASQALLNAHEQIESAQELADKAEAAAEDAQRYADQANEYCNEFADIMDQVVEATGDYESLDDRINDVSIDANDLGLEQDAETGFVYPTYRNVRSENGIPLAATGGGGGTSITYSITLRNLMEGRSFSVAENSPAVVNFSYVSIDEDGYDDGAGVGSIYIGGLKVATVNVPQGENELDISPYLSNGENSVKIKIENSDGMSKSVSYTITVIAISLSSTLLEEGKTEGFIVCHDDTLTVYYTPTGSGVKTIHFIMDGVEIGTSEVKSTGRSQTYIIERQAHGAHTLEIYAEMTISDVTVTSNKLHLEILWVATDSSEPIISFIANVDSATQGETINVPYMIYDPSTEVANLTLSVIDEDGDEYTSQQLSVDRGEHIWNVIDYPAGEIKLRFNVGGYTKNKEITVYENSVEIDHITDSLAFYFDPAGRNNNEENPEYWSNGVVAAQFSGVGFATADGWLSDDNGSPIFRLLPGGTITIPYEMFSSDKRTSGCSIEVEMTTHNVRDYDSIVMSCLSNGRGVKIASQYAQLKSEQSEIGMQFKEDERVRVSFVVEPKSLNRLIYVYVDGVMCGAIQYPEDDNFAQSPSLGITIGAESSGIDIYKVYFYDKGLTRLEVLNNYIADRSTLSDRLDAYRRNDIFNANEEVVINKLPTTLPYMVISCSELPQTKGDKKTCEITYVNPSDSSKNFTASGVEIDVQGTSSAGYKKKNFKIKMKNGLTYTSDGTVSENYKLRDDSIPVSVFCMKADVASSESANNVELVRLYNDVCPYTTDAQASDNRVRVGIDGVPCVVFWQNPTSGVTRFWGKYNFNNEKSNHEVYGLTNGCESWEICNNTSDRVVFKKSDYETGWTDDFEARYPEDNLDYTRLKRMTDWVASTNREAVQTEEEKAELLAKFKNEFEDYFVKTPMLFYYIFTEVFLMIDNRAKNFFPTTYDGVHWMPLPYDMDTAIGINNEGALVFDYDLEDTDHIDGEDVYNGQDSVLWCNIRDAFSEEIAEMYASLRSGTLFNYEETVKRFSEHQKPWCEAIWNEDAYEKYLEPLINDNDGSYLTMLQGNKASQREWWLHNGFRYRDSKYQTGDASKEFITLRCYNVGDITVTPYSHIWSRIKYGSYTVTERGKRNVPVTLSCPLDKMTDTEVYIYSADRLADIGDLSHLQVGYANFSMASKLQKLKLGDNAIMYQNPKLTELYVGNNELLTEIDIRNCVNLAQAIDLSGCTSIEKVYAAGSGISAATLPVGGKVSTLELPATITNLTIRNQKSLSVLSVAGYSNLATLRIENTPNVPIETILNSASSLNRVRLIGVSWNATSEDALALNIERLKSCGGMDANGDNTSIAVVNGVVYIDAISDELLEEIHEVFPDLTVVVGGVITYLVRYLNYDGTVLFKDLVNEGGDVIDPVALGLIDPPIRVGTETLGYAYIGWNHLPTNIHSNVVVLAQYEEVPSYLVTYQNPDGEILYEYYVAEHTDAIDPVSAGKIETPTMDGTSDVKYTFSSWNAIPTNVQGEHTVVAQYITAYAVRFYNESELLYTDWVNEGNDAVDPVVSGVIDAPTKQPSPEYRYVYSGWGILPTNITRSINVTAQFSSQSQVYNVIFYDKSNLLNVLYSTTASYGGNCVYSGSDLLIPDGCVFIGWMDNYGNSYSTNSVLLNEDNCKISGGIPVDIQLYPIIEVPTPKLPTTQKTSFEDYTWLEIKALSNAIASGTTNEVTVTYDDVEKIYSIHETSTGITSTVALFDTKDLTMNDGTTITMQVSGFLHDEDESGNKVGISMDTKNLYSTITKQHYSGSHTFAHYKVNGVQVADNQATYTHTQGEVAGNVEIESTGETYIASVKVTDVTGAMTWYYFSSSTGTNDENNVYYTFAKSNNVAQGNTLSWNGLTIDATNGAFRMPEAYNNKFVIMESGAKLIVPAPAGSTVLITMYSSYNIGGYENTILRAYLTGELFDNIPTILSTILVPVKKGSSLGGMSYEVEYMYDKVYALSMAEVGLSTTTNPYKYEGSQYPIYTDSASRIKLADNGAGSAYYWWLRSPYCNNENSFYRVYSSGDTNGSYAYYSYRVAFGFAL